MTDDDGTVSVRPPADRDHTPDADAAASQVALRLLQQELEVSRAREERLRADNHRLAEALEQAERQLADLTTLREEAEIGRRATGAALRLQVLESSSSWRLTRPLRMMMEARRAAERWRRP